MLGKRKLISNSWKVQISMFFNLLTDKHVSLVQFYMKCKYLFRLFQFRGVRLSEGKLSGLSSMARWGDALLETKWELRLPFKGFCKIVTCVTDKFNIYVKGVTYVTNFADWGDALLETKWELRLPFKGFCKIVTCVTNVTDKFDIYVTGVTYVTNFADWETHCWRPN